MAIPSRQIGWGTEENLLWQISKQLEALTGVTYNSKKTLLNVEDPHYNNPNIRAKIETFSGAFAGTFSNSATSPFLTVDLNTSSGGIIEYSLISFDGSSRTGTMWFTAVNQQLSTNQRSSSGGNGDDYIEAIQENNLVNFIIGNNGSDVDVEILFTVKLFTLPMYTD